MKRFRQPRHLLFAAFFLAVAHFAMRAVAAEVPSVEFGKEGLSRLRWAGQELHGEKGFGVDGVVLQRVAPEAKASWGLTFESAPVENPKTRVEARRRRVTRHYEWGTASALYEPKPDQLDVTLTIHNQVDRPISDFRVRVLELSVSHDPAHKQGITFLTLDRPVWFEIPLESGGRVFATCDTIHPPIKLGLSRARLHDASESRKGKMLQSVYVAGGVPADKGDTGVQPLLGVPHIEPGESLELTFAFRFAAEDIPDSEVLLPYMQAFRNAQRPHMHWVDRRPIGRIEIPSRPEAATLKNPRGWFRDPTLDVDTEQGAKRLRERLNQFATACLEGMAAANAQGMLVWNIEGGHIYPDQPLGDPRHLEDIAPEMNALADEFFQRFRDAGYRTGVCIRPSDLHFGKERQRWTQGAGFYNPEYEDIDGVRDGVPDHVPNERIYPLVQRMSAKIHYAKQRWGCTLFYVEYNGAWRRMSPHWGEDWLLVEARVLQRVREQHPDVLLIPAYAERHWRTSRTRELRTVRENNRMGGAVPELYDMGVDMPLPPRAARVSLRGVDEARVGAAPTPAYVVANQLELERLHRGRYYPKAPSTFVRDAYWSTAAPYVKLRQWRLHKEYILTLEQHMEYSVAEAEQMARDAIAFETTPASIRGWMPEAVTVIDTSGADVEMRRSMITRAAAWGDVLMWNANTSPTDILSLVEPSQAMHERVTQAAATLGIADWKPGDPLLPVSLVWQKGDPVQTSKLIAGKRAPDRLHARIAYSPDRRRGLLMLAWPTGGGETVKLNPQLPGVQLAGEHTKMWDLETGAMPPADEPFVVRPDPLARFNVLLVEAADAAPNVPPEGVALGVSFDESTAPDLGEAMPPRPAKLPPVSGGALPLAGRELAYNLIPSWYEGTIEFDLRIAKSADGLRLVRLRHHLNLDLTLAERQGKPGVLLTARDRHLRTGGIETREGFAPLPAREVHVVLTWEIGQYRLYVDGTMAASVAGPVALGRRDGAVMTPGLVLGDAEARGAKAALDSLLVYDWSLPREQATARRGNRGLNPAEKAPKKRIVAWTWGAFPKKVSVGLNARAVEGYPRVEKFAVGLFERVPVGQKHIGNAELGVFGGMATGSIRFNPNGEIRADSAPPEVRFDDADEPGMDMGMELDGLAGELEMDTGTTYILEIVPLPKDAGVKPRTIEFEAGPAGAPDPRL